MAAPEVPPSVDYIIIGGGTAGLVIANRLSEDPNVEVLVLEAGQNLLHDPRVRIPAAWRSLLKTEADWNFQTTPQAGLNGRSITLPQGKLFGGSSGINAGAIIAASRSGHNAWAELGAQGWDWESMLPYYRKFYTLHQPDEALKERLELDWLENSVQGQNGPIQTSFPGLPADPLQKLWIETFKTLGRTTNADPFTGSSEGGYANILAVDPQTKTRSYAGSEYGAPAMKRPNFHILFDATTKKIVFDESSSLRATGVEVSIKGEDQVQSFHARKEIILCAGAYNSPKILELSGIGSSDILSPLGIAVVVDLPGVGEHLQDQLMSLVSYEVVEGTPTLDDLSRGDEETLASVRNMYIKDKAGPLTAGGVTCHAFMPIIEYANGLIDLYDSTKSSSNKQEQLWSDAVRSVLDDSNNGSAALFAVPVQTPYNTSTPNFDGGGNIPKPENYVSFGLIQEQVFSRGSCHIVSKDVDVKPEIDHKYFDNDLDLEIMARHILWIDKVLRRTKAMASVIKPNGERNHPDAFIETLEDAKKYLRDSATTCSHGCGSNAMLPREMGGVVDNELRVYGISNLRVADSSIFPMVPRCNTSSTVYAVAERAADIIKQTAK